MSVRVNLLPGEVAERNKAARQRALAGAAGLGVIGLLAAAYVFQVDRVNDAQATLDAEQARVVELQGEVAELDEFGQLEQRRELADVLLAAALADEASVAGALQDLATVMPSDTELTSLSITLAETEPVLGSVGPSLGKMTLAGRTLQGHAPGLERLLLELGKIATFENVYFTSSTVDEFGVSTFSVELELNEEILTNRYADGLPEELR